MKDFMEAMIIFQSYSKREVNYPFNCEHDAMRFYGLTEEEINGMPEKAINRLEELGFIKSEEFGEPHFISFRYGSC